MGKLFDNAICFAAQKHSGQLRKGTTIPYIVHPMEAAAIVATVTDDDELLAAAVLHDTLEDTEATYDEIVQTFGNRVAALVADESENKRKELAADATWQVRKQETIDHLKTASHEARLIALGDKLSSIRAILRDYEAQGEAFWKRFNQSDPSLQGWYYGSIADIFEADPALADTPACREFREKVDQVFHK